MAVTKKASKDTAKEVKVSTAKTEQVNKKYNNEKMNEVLMGFESNESVVYLLNLITKAYKKEPSMTRVNKAIAALHILAAAKETGPNTVVVFSKLTLEELRNTIKASLTEEIVEMCLVGIDALQNAASILKASKELEEELKSLQKRFEKINKVIQK